MKSPSRSAMSTAGLSAVLLCATPMIAESTEVRFENSCSAEVQSELAHAVTLLHSFEYPETRTLFAEIIEKEPSCAMAYWGAAMSLWHPLWAPPSQADLEEGAALLERAEGLPMTEREAAYLGAIRGFFSSTDASTHLARVQEFELAMAELYAEKRVGICFSGV